MDTERSKRGVYHTTIVGLVCIKIDSVFAIVKHVKFHFNFQEFASWDAFSSVILFSMNMLSFKLIFVFSLLNSVGVTFTKWAIEYEEQADKSIRRNHPETAVFVDNCNVILK